MTKPTAAILILAMASTAGAGQSHRADISAQPVKTLRADDATVSPHPVNGALLVIGFSRESNAEARDWSRRLAAALDAAPTPADRLPLFNIVVLAGAPRLVRSLVRRSMRSAIPEQQHGMFFTAEDDAEYWRSLAAVTDDDVAYVLRVDPSGRVCGRHQGAVTDQALAVLLDVACPKEADAP